jgi:predicted HAD superfamily Cof-like phosphohydrolase
MFAKITQFTSAASGVAPTQRPMTKEETEFLVKMVMDECFELLVTQSSPEKARESMELMVEAMEVPKNIEFPTEEDVIVGQADAMIDICYYVGDAAAKVKIDLDECFEEIHESNMAKQVNGKFMRRDDGKILKPSGWKEPDLYSILFPKTF